MATVLARKYFGVFALSAAALLFAGCRSNQQPANTANSSDQNQPAAQDESSANLVPVANTTTGADTSSNTSSPAAVNSPAAASSPSAPDNSGSYSSSPSYASAPDQGDDTADESAYGIQPAATAPQPPPPLPQYDQPPCPDDGDIWTPGHWYWAPTGYFWVPGAWVQAPYQGALWTPGYWGYSHRRYAYFAGYWGPHIGFYGGINYGFGYAGLGYQGGYWRGRDFVYNRAVNNVNVNVIHNVYNRTVINNYTVVNRVSFNGGNGGIQVRPRLAELAALREPHAPRMQSQIEIERAASQNRGQFAAVNHGRPSAFVETRVIVADHEVHPAVWSSVHNLPPAARPAMGANRGPEPGPRGEPNHPQPMNPQVARPEPNRPEPHAVPNHQEMNHGQAQRNPEAQPRNPAVQPHHPEAPQHQPQAVQHHSESPQHQPQAMQHQQGETRTPPPHRPEPDNMHRPAPDKKPAPDHRPNRNDEKPQ